METGDRREEMQEKKRGDGEAMNESGNRRKKGRDAGEEKEGGRGEIERRGK